MIGHSTPIKIKKKLIEDVPSLKPIRGKDVPLEQVLKLLFRWQNKRNEMINNPDALAKKKALRDGVDTDGEMADEQEEVIIEKMIKQEETVVDPATLK